jgi:hypothetical protein
VDRQADFIVTDKVKPPGCQLGFAPCGQAAARRPPTGITICNLHSDISSSSQGFRKIVFDFFLPAVKIAK